MTTGTIGLFIFPARYVTPVLDLVQGTAGAVNGKRDIFPAAQAFHEAEERLSAFSLARSPHDAKPEPLQNHRPESRRHGFHWQGRTIPECRCV